MGNLCSCIPRSTYKRIRQINTRADNVTPHYRYLGEEKLQRVVSLRSISRFACNIGIGFEAIGLDLDLSLAAIEHCKMSHEGSPYCQIVAMLTKWRETRGSAATYRALMESLERCNPCCTIDWENILLTVTS